MRKENNGEMTHLCTCLPVFFLLGSISLSVLNYMGFYASAQERHGETMLEGQG